MGKSKSNLSRNLAICGLLVGVVAAVIWRVFPKAPVQGPPENHRYFTVNQIWSDAEIELLDRFIEKERFVSVAADFTAKVSHIGEAVPVEPDGSCKHMLMVPDLEGKMCLFPSRLDIGRHFLLTGGYSGWKETYEKLVSRMLGFSKFFHSKNAALENFPFFDTLFNSEGYQTKATEMCENRPVFDPIQLGIIVQVPGQEVAMHYDVPWFYGATRFTIPQWLLVVMLKSGLFEDRRVPQVQGVAYLHRWDAEDPANGGGFFYYPQGPAGKDLVYPARFNTGIVLDGSVVVHGTEPYRPGTVNPVVINKDDVNEILFVGNSTWEVRSNGQPRAQYATSDLRISLVWRARCFKDEADKKHWTETQDDLTQEYVLNKLVEDLRHRGRLPKDAPVPAPTDLAIMLLDEYVQYPLGHSWFPYNLCMIGRVAPSFLKPLFQAIC